MAKDEAKKGVEAQGYEQVITRLEEVIKRLEAGNLPLEESLKAFEEGIALVRAGEARLNEAERRVEQLVATPAGDKVVPFEAEQARTAEPPRTSASRPAASRAPSPPPDDDTPF